MIICYLMFAEKQSQASFLQHHLSIKADCHQYNNTGASRVKSVSIIALEQHPIVLWSSGNSKKWSWNSSSYWICDGMVSSRPSGSTQKMGFKVKLITTGRTQIAYWHREKFPVLQQEPGRLWNREEEAEHFHPCQLYYAKFISIEHSIFMTSLGREPFRKPALVRWFRSRRVEYS